MQCSPTTPFVKTPIDKLAVTDQAVVTVDPYDVAVLRAQTETALGDGCA